MKLTNEQRQTLHSWLKDRLDEMLPDKFSITEEEPHLIPGIRALLKELKKEPLGQFVEGNPVGTCECCGGGLGSEPRCGRCYEARLT